MKNVIWEPRSGDTPKKLELGALKGEERAKQIGDAILLYEEALGEALEQADKLRALGVDSAPWVYHKVESNYVTEYGSWLSPGPRMRLETR